MLITCVKSNDTTNTAEDLKFTGILQNDLNCYIAPPGFLVPKYPIVRIDIDIDIDNGLGFVVLVGSAIAEGYGSQQSSGYGQQQYSKGYGQRYKGGYGQEQSKGGYGQEQSKDGYGQQEFIWIWAAIRWPRSRII
ncbi:hypothetical protein GQR58_023861 [Nymphon striatum]|nr:hypothetical protein GQR58_023861 [Nymphon striatum]